MYRAGAPAAIAVRRTGQPWADGAFANTDDLRQGCSLFPATGVVVLCQTGADFASQPTRLPCP